MEDIIVLMSSIFIILDFLFNITQGRLSQKRAKTFEAYRAGNLTYNYIMYLLYIWLPGINT